MYIPMDLPMDHLMVEFIGPSYRPFYRQTYTPYGSRYPHVYQSPKYGFVAPHPQGTPNHNPYMKPYMGQMGGVYYPTGQGHGVYSS